MLRPACSLPAARRPPPHGLSTPRLAQGSPPDAWGLLPGAPALTGMGLPPAGVAQHSLGLGRPRPWSSRRTMAATLRLSGHEDNGGNAASSVLPSTQSGNRTARSGWRIRTGWRSSPLSSGRVVLHDRAADPFVARRAGGRLQAAEPSADAGGELLCGAAGDRDLQPPRNRLSGRSTRSGAPLRARRTAATGGLGAGRGHRRAWPEGAEQPDRSDPFRRSRMADHSRWRRVERRDAVEPGWYGMHRQVEPWTEMVSPTVSVISLCHGHT